MMEVKKFRKLPVVIEAIQLAPNGEPTAEDVDRLHEFLGGATWNSDHDSGIQIETEEGVMRGDPGDWIIKGVAGEFYPCKPDIFAKTYEPA